MGTLQDTRPPGFLVARTLPNGCEVRVVGNARSWIETEAIDQLERTGARFGMRHAVGLPDLHPGKGHPVGAAFVTEFAVYPTLVGNDIGCGMALWRTGIPSHWRDFDRWSRRLEVLDRPCDEAAFTSELAEAAGWRASLGTIGGGNHFAELQAVAEIRDEATFAALGLEKRRLVLVVHSGSRGLGESILRMHTRDHGDGGLKSGSHELGHYLRRHDEAVAWAEDNRKIIAGRFLRAVKAEGERVLDLTHNAVVQTDGEGRAFLHRKGAAPADAGCVVLPGSRGARSYLVKPTAQAGATDLCARSLAHGAGRRWKRSDCRGRLARKSPEQLERTKFGSRVVCHDRALLFEEAPEAYKDVDAVVGDLVAAGLATVVAVMEPVLTFKTAKGRDA